MSGRTKPLILVVDDEPDIRSILKTCLEWQGFAIEEAGSGTEALNKAMERRPDAILMDQGLPDFDGDEVHLHLVEMGIHIPMALMSGSPGAEQAGRNAGLHSFLWKPISFETLEEFVWDLLSQPGELA